MRMRLLLIAWLTAMISLGYVLGISHDQFQEWDADQGLLTSLGVSPAALPALSTEEEVEGTATGLRFESLPNSSVGFVYENGPEHQFHLAETIGGGVGAMDFDCDANPDLMFVDGGDPINWRLNRTERVSLYRNQGDTRFALVGDECRLSWTGYSHGCAVADVNNDGFDDVMITGYEQSGLFLNQGDGTFQESPRLRDLTAERWCATACWSDLDGDGDLDVYISCYADCSRALPTPVCESKGVRVHCNPHSYRPVSDLMFESTGDDGFVDRSESAGISRYSEYGLGVIAADLDRDGSQEIYVANDGDRNLLFRRTSDWVYEETAIASGVAFNGHGATMGSMGVACADFDQNGRLDLFTTNFSSESNALFQQLDSLAFVDNTQGTVIDRISRDRVGWSALALDADGDRWIDLFVANGHVTQIPGEEWAQLPSLLKGGPEGYLAARGAGPWFDLPWHARGACRADLNRDGLDDLIVSLIDDPAAILLNTAPSPGHRIQLRLIGTASPRSPEGAIVEVESRSGKTLHCISRNAGFLSSNGDVVTLGLGADAVADSVRIFWPSGELEELREIASGSRVTVIERQRSLVEHGWRSPNE